MHLDELVGLLRHRLPLTVNRDAVTGIVERDQLLVGGANLPVGEPRAVRMDGRVEGAVDDEQWAGYLGQEPPDLSEQFQKFVGGESGGVLVTPEA